MRTKRWYRDWLGWVIVGSIVYSVLCLISLASDVGRPFPGFITFYNAPLNRIEIIYNVPGWWWFRDESLPNITDKIISVEGISFTNLTSPIYEQDIYEKLQSNGEKSVSIQIQRHDEILSLETPLQIFSWRHYVELALGPFIMSGSLILLAIRRFPKNNHLFVIPAKAGIHTFTRVDSCLRR
ncbi:MAG: hypothetical protein GWP17_05415, partial [Aquificales bacterium]|nr:hypothetical protein [Aquificales bacterium]